MSNDNTPNVSSKLKDLGKKVAATLGIIAVKAVQAIVVATLAAVSGFVIAGAAAFLVPGAVALPVLAFAKIGGSVALLVRVVKEAA